MENCYAIHSQEIEEIIDLLKQIQEEERDHILLEARTGNKEDSIKKKIGEKKE